MTAFEAQTSRWRMGLLLLAGAGFVAAGVWLVTTSPAASRRSIAGWAAIVVFGALFLIGLPRLKDQDTEMRIDAHGIWWRRWSNEIVPWAAIDQITQGEIRSQRFVCLFLRDRTAYPSTTFAGKLAGVNRAMGFGDIALSPAGTNRSFTDLQAAIDQFAPPSLRA